jgi:hypothetical protein
MRLVADPSTAHPNRYTRPMPYLTETYPHRIPNPSQQTILHHIPPGLTYHSVVSIPGLVISFVSLVITSPLLVISTLYLVISVAEGVISVSWIVISMLYWRYIDGRIAPDYPIFLSSAPYPFKNRCSRGKKGPSGSQKRPFYWYCSSYQLVYGAGSIKKGLTKGDYPLLGQQYRVLPD